MDGKWERIERDLARFNGGDPQGCGYATPELDLDEDIILDPVSDEPVRLVDDLSDDEFDLGPDLEFERVIIKVELEELDLSDSDLEPVDLGEPSQPVASNPGWNWRKYFWLVEWLWWGWILINVLLFVRGMLWSSNDYSIPLITAIWGTVAYFIGRSKR